MVLFKTIFDKNMLITRHTLYLPQNLMDALRKLQSRQIRLFAARITCFLQVILYDPSSHIHVSLRTLYQIQAIYKPTNIRHRKKCTASQS